MAPASYWKNGIPGYEGELSYGLPNGSGVSYYPDGKPAYEGRWTAGKKNGTGRLYDRNGVLYYEGEIRDDRIDGKGIYYFPENDEYGRKWYYGSFTDGIFNGLGTMLWIDGTLYEGEWKDGRRSGTGKYTWQSGKKYIGEWDQDLMSGKGELYHLNGWLEFSGEFKTAPGHGTLYRSRKAGSV